MAVSQTIPEEELKEAYSAAPNYDVDYNDPRFGKVETDKQQALTELEQTYGGMIDSTDKFYDDLKNANQEWADKQAQIQQEQTDFAIEKIEQQKEQAEKDYIKEQSGAYVDYKKQSSKYGTEAEKLAGAGLTNTGYAESSQVSMYNTYQKRVATAREALVQAKLQYDNGIKEAMLQNNAALAEIYANAFIKQAELALEGFQYKNELVLEKANKKTELENIYYNRWQDTLAQINTENALKEDIRQYNETMKWNTEQNELDRAHQSAENELNRKHQSAENELNRQFEAKQAEIEREFEAKQDELTRKHDEAMLKAKTAEEKEILAQQHKNDLAKLAQQHKNDLAILTQEKNDAIAKINAQAEADQATYKYKHDLEEQPLAPIPIVSDFTGKTYDSAVAYLKANGLSSAVSGLLPKNEWLNRRRSYTSTGIGTAEVANYESYADYLKEYVSYHIGNNGE